MARMWSQRKLREFVARGYGPTPEELAEAGGSREGGDGASPSPPPPTTLTARLRAGLARLLRSEIQPGIVTDRSGEARPGIWWRKKL